jgi:(p)ppGpp synthase/HD superfamily hydrolase
MDELKFKKLREIARKQYNDSNCTYGDDKTEYIYHIDMVVNMVVKYENIFHQAIDRETSIIAALFHDSIEDAKQSFNNIADVTGKPAADVTLAVTDVPAENRLMKHLLTMGKTVKDYRAIILKMCDMGSNATYSKRTGSSMYKKYVAEYAYRKPIFQMALPWYKDKLSQTILVELWKELDEIHNPNLK